MTASTAHLLWELAGQLLVLVVLMICIPAAFRLYRYMRELSAVPGVPKSVPAAVPDDERQP